MNESPRKWYEIKDKADNEAEVWIYEEIGADFWGEGLTAKVFVKELAALDVSAIALHINSPGGSVFDGQAIYNALKNHKATVTSYVDGVAASISSVIALAGEKVIMASNALFMIHDPFGLAMGNAEDMRKMADILDKVKGAITGVYADKSGKPMAEIEQAMSDETWFSASEAQDFGFVDEVAGKLDVAARFDFQSLGYHNVPQDSEPDPIADESTDNDDHPAPDAAEAPSVPPAEGTTQAQSRPLVPAHAYKSYLRKESPDGTV